MPTTPKDDTKQDHHVECVGSLLVCTTDLQELTDKAAPLKVPKTVRDGEMVGSLLVPQKDLQELSETAADSPKSNLVKRVTERITDDVTTSPDDFNPWSNHK